VKLPYAALAALLTAAPAHGHHSGSVFNTSVVVAAQGTVTRFRWGNPHVYIYVEAPSDSGEMQEWEIETDATPILTRSGWSADTLRAGDRVVVRMNPVYDTKRTHARLLSLTKEDGSVWSARSSFAGSTSDLAGRAQARDFSGVWATPLSTNAHLWELRDSVRKLTARGAAMQSAYDVATESPAGQCIPYPTPAFLAVPYLNEITIYDDRITIKGELFNTVRTIWTDGRGHPEDGEPTNQGHSIGHWEGNVLVVDTTLLQAHRSPLIDGAPMGARRRIAERFRLSEDRTRLLIDFRVEDPEFLAEPFSGTLEWVYMPELEPIGIDCDPEVARRSWGTQ
jgi:Family of unknown function (DUF6152)